MIEREKISNMTDEQVEAEIAELQSSELVKLAHRVRWFHTRKRKYLASLRSDERAGERLKAEGWTFEKIKALYKEIENCEPKEKD